MLKEESAPQASIWLCNHRLVLEQFSISSLNMDSSTVRRKGKVNEFSWNESGPCATKSFHDIASTKNSVEKSDNIIEW